MKNQSIVEESGVFEPFSAEKERVSSLFAPSLDAVHWLIALRWLAFVTLIALLAAEVFLLNYVQDPFCYFPLTIGVAFVGAVNAGFAYIAEKRVATERQLTTQIIFDLAILSILIHYSGGCENPLFLVYVFHAILAGILLPRRSAYRLTILGVALFSLVAISELFRVLPHYTLAIFPHQVSAEHAAHIPLHVFTLLGVFLVIMLVVTYLATSVADGLRSGVRREREAVHRLHQATKMAAIGELAGNVAHEINNPIGIILLKVRNILADRRGKDEGKMMADLETIDRHTERIASIVRDLLKFSRPSSEVKGPLDIRKLLEESLGLTRTYRERYGVRLKTDLGAYGRTIDGNATEVQQIFVNIINNAVEAMPRGGELAIGVVVKEAGDADLPLPGVRIEIRDTGGGIAPEHLDRIFLPFFSTKGQSGTGLGLAICHTIVKSHNGAIWVESAPGKGTSFFVFFPFAEVAK